MEIKLNYVRMADMVYATAALKSFETGAERVIGRREEPALIRMFKRALLEVSIQLRPAVRVLNTASGTISLDVSEPLAHQMLEAAVLKKVLSRLSLTDDDPETYVRILRGLTSPLPKLKQN